MTIGAGKSVGRLATTRDSASMPPAEEPITTSCASAAFLGTLLILDTTVSAGACREQLVFWRACFHPRERLYVDVTFARTRAGATRPPSRVAARQATLGPPWPVAPTLATDR